MKRGEVSLREVGDSLRGADENQSRILFASPTSTSASSNGICVLCSRKSGCVCGGNMLDRGLDLSNLRELSPDEADAFSKTYERSHGTMLPAYDFWLHQQPEVLKRHRLQARWTPGEERLQLPLHGTLGFLHLYAILGYSFGIQYETQHSRSLGASKEAVL